MQFFDSENITLLMYSPKDVPRHVFVALTKRHQNLAFRLWFTGTILALVATFAAALHLQEQSWAAEDIPIVALVGGLTVSAVIAIFAGATNARRMRRVQFRALAFAGAFRKNGLVRSSDPSYQYVIAEDAGRRVASGAKGERARLYADYFGNPVTIRADNYIKNGPYGSRPEGVTGSYEPINGYFSAKFYLAEQAQTLIVHIVGKPGTNPRSERHFRKHFDLLQYKLDREIDEMEQTAAYKLRIIREQQIRSRSIKQKTQ